MKEEIDSVFWKLIDLKTPKIKDVKRFTLIIDDNLFEVSKDIFRNLNWFSSVGAHLQDAAHFVALLLGNESAKR